MMPAVSVVMTSYNYAAYLGEAVASVLAQTWTDWELLVVDDGSTDDSVAIVEDFARRDPRIRLLRHGDGGNHGLPASLERGIKAAVAPLVAFLESDDAWRPDCLERRLQAFSRYEADVVVNTAEPVPMGQCSISRIRRYLANMRRRFPRSGPVAPCPGLWFGNVVPSFSCAMVRRSRLLSCCLDAPEPAWLDWWVWLQLAPSARFVWLDEPLTRWRVHAASYSASISGAGGRKKHLLRRWCARPGACPPGWLRLVLHLPGPALGVLGGVWLLGLRLRWLLERSAGEEAPALEQHAPGVAGRIQGEINPPL